MLSRCTIRPGGFVVQRREGTPLTSAPLSTQVEHIVSGHANSVAWPDGLLAFMAQVLTLRGTAPTAKVVLGGYPLPPSPWQSSSERLNPLKYRDS